MKIPFKKITLLHQYEETNFYPAISGFSSGRYAGETTSRRVTNLLQIFMKKSVRKYFLLLRRLTIRGTVGFSLL